MIECSIEYDGEYIGTLGICGYGSDVLNITYQGLDFEMFTYPDEPFEVVIADALCTASNMLTDDVE